jgi:hypothetical protein
MWRSASIAGFVLLIVASAPHFASWMASVHSRNYLLEQFRLGFAADMRHTSRLVAGLNASGQSDLADILVQSVLKNERVDWEIFQPFLHDRFHDAVKAMSLEVNRFDNARSYP